MEHKIPKIIHYCWFGNGKKTQLVEKCIDSWKKFMPEYQIIEWNERNFNINISQYTKQAYFEKKWAFLSDFVRLYALYCCGGVYMDSDVEALKSFDCFLNHRAFTGHETEYLPITAVLGAEKKHPWIKMLLDYYDTAELNNVPNTQIITKLSMPLVEKHENNFRLLKDDVHVYPVDVFCPFDHVNLKVLPNKKTYAMHHFQGSWLNRKK